MSEDDAEVEVDPLAPVDMPSGDRLDDMIRKKFPELMAQRPGERMFDYALARISMIQHRERVEGINFNSGWLREYLMMQDVRKLIEWMHEQQADKEQKTLEKKAADDKKWKGKPR